MGQHSSIHNTANKQNLKSLKKLIKTRHIDINEQVGEKTVLFNAVKDNWTEAVDILLENGADPNVLCTILRADGYSFLWTAIHEACRQNNLELLRSLLEHGGNVNLQAHHQMSTLNVAAWHGHKEAVEILISNGCDVNALDRFQESALVIPICNGDMEVVETLLNAGCKLNTRAWGNLSIRCSRRVEVFFCKEGPFSLLSLSIMYGHFDIATTLLQHGYNPNKYEMYVFLKIIKNSTGEIDDEGMHLIECYIAAGYRLKSGEEKNMLDHLLSPPNYGFKKEMITWVKEQIGCPSLKALCRMTIRGVIRNNLGDRSIYKALDDVPLPSYLLKFVKLEAFKNENIVMPTYAIPQQCVCCLERKMRGKHEVDFRDSLTGEGPYSLLALAIKFSWLNIARQLIIHGYNPNRYDLYDLTLDVKQSVGSLNGQFKQLIECKIAAGYRFKPRDETQLDFLLLPPHQGFTSDIIDWIKSKNILPTLQHLCRCIIRKALRLHCKNTSILHRLYNSDINLPVQLLDYIGLKEFCDNVKNERGTVVLGTWMEKEPLYFAMPRKRPQNSSHVYLQFWKLSCCCFNK